MMKLTLKGTDCLTKWYIQTPDIEDVPDNVEEPQNIACKYYLKYYAFHI